ncbi:hypothetical protein IWQ61_007944 [Dispira simplex]|nr:hypothetical protein IWQ61_007944 [Dispira simplex]
MNATVTPYSTPLNDRDATASYNMEVKTIPPFAAKLFESLDKSEFAHCIKWDPTGTMIHVTDCKEFTKVVLPVYFKTRMFNSFVRQLHIYGFTRKSDARKNRGENMKNQCVFQHPYFQKDRRDLLHHIKRQPQKNARDRYDFSYYYPYHPYGYSSSYNNDASYAPYKNDYPTPTMSHQYPNSAEYGSPAPAYTSTPYSGDQRSYHESDTGYYYQQHEYAAETDPYYGYVAPTSTNSQTAYSHPGYSTQTSSAHQTPVITTSHAPTGQGSADLSQNNIQFPPSPNSGTDIPKEPTSYRVPVQSSYNYYTPSTTATTTAATRDNLIRSSPPYERNPVSAQGNQVGNYQYPQNASVNYSNPQSVDPFPASIVNSHLVAGLVNSNEPNSTLNIGVQQTIYPYMQHKA